jgi:hypothetical protein
LSIIPHLAQPASEPANGAAVKAVDRVAVANREVANKEGAAVREGAAIMEATNRRRGSERAKQLGENRQVRGEASGQRRSEVRQAKVEGAKQAAYVREREAGVRGRRAWCVHALLNGQEVDALRVDFNIHVQFRDIMFRSCYF